MSLSVDTKIVNLIIKYKIFSNIRKPGLFEISRKINYFYKKILFFSCEGKK